MFLVGNDAVKDFIDQFDEVRSLSLDIPEVPVWAEALEHFDSIEVAHPNIEGLVVQICVFGILKGYDREEVLESFENSSIVVGSSGGPMWYSCSVNITSHAAFSHSFGGAYERNNDGSFKFTPTQSPYEWYICLVGIPSY